MSEVCKGCGEVHSEDEISLKALAEAAFEQLSDVVGKKWAFLTKQVIEQFHVDEGTPTFDSILAVGQKYALKETDLPFDFAKEIKAVLDARNH